MTCFGAEERLSKVVLVLGIMMRGPAEALALIKRKKINQSASLVGGGSIRAFAGSNGHQSFESPQRIRVVRTLLLLALLLLLLLHLLLLKRLLLVVMLLLWVLLRLSCWKTSETSEVGMHHSIYTGVSHVLRRLMPPVAPWFSSKGRSRHGMLVKRSTLGRWRLDLVAWPWLLFKSDRWLVQACLIDLALDRLMDFGCPHPGAVARRSLVSYVKTAQTALQADIIHVEISPLISLYGFHHWGSQSRFVVNAHGRCVTPRG